MDNVDNNYLNIKSSSYHALCVSFSHIYFTSICLFLNLFCYFLYNAANVTQLFCIHFFQPNFFSFLSIHFHVWRTWGKVPAGRDSWKAYHGSKYGSNMVLFLLPVPRSDLCTHLLPPPQGGVQQSQATSLPLHRPCGCAIELLPGSTIPKERRLYSVSGLKWQAMKDYTESSLKMGLVCPSSSPAGASFFFASKKNESLGPCIDYGPLKNRYPHPLMMFMFDQLRQATVFTKLDLR